MSCKKTYKKKVKVDGHTYGGVYAGVARALQEGRICPQIPQSHQPRKDKERNGRQAKNAPSPKDTRPRSLKKMSKLRAVHLRCELVQ